MLTGRWKKRAVSDSRQAVYPDILEFRSNGLYTGTPSEPGHFVIWDVGRYVVESPAHLKLSTANDAEVVYSFDLAGDELTIDDGQGSRIRYERAKE